MRVRLPPPVIDSLATLCEALTVYVPVPPVPVPNAVIVVPAAIPLPVTTWPTERVPVDTAETVSVVPLRDPVNTAPVTVPVRLTVLALVSREKLARALWVKVPPRFSVAHY